MAKIKIGRLMCFILFFLLVFSVSVSAEPQLVAASYQNFSAVDGKPAVTENIKIKNIGDADAFNVSASIYSPNSATEITDLNSGQSFTLSAGEKVSITNGLDWKVTSASTGEKNYALNTTGAICSEPDFIDGVTSGHRWDYTKPVLINLSEVRIIDELIVYIGGIPSEGYEEHYIRFKGSSDGSNWETLAELSAVNGDGNFNSMTVFSIDPTAVKYIKYEATLTTNCGPVAGRCGYNLPTSEIEVSGPTFSYNAPVINILYYNGVSNEKRFLSDVKLENPDDSLDSFGVGDMIHEPKLRTSTLETYTYDKDMQITLTYTNPHDKAVQGGRIISSYSLLNGTEVSYEEQDIDLGTGDTEVNFNWNPSDYGSEVAGKQVILTSTAVDYQDSVLDDRVELINITLPFELTGWSPSGNETISEGNSQDFSVTASSEMGNIAYKWYADGQEITGETSSSYTYEADYQSNGFHNISVQVSDGTFNDSISWNLTVTDVNAVPVLEPFVQVNASEGDLISISPKASDPDGDVLSFIYSLPLNETGKWQTDFEDSGFYNLSVNISDGEFNDSQEIKINISNSNRAPVLEIYPDLIVEEGSVIELSPNATDSDNENNVSNDDNVLIFNYSGAMTSNTWKTDYSDAGNYTVNITVSDGELIDSQNISIEIQDKEKPESSSSSSGGSGGGGGGAGGTPLPQCNAKIGTVSPGTTKIASCSNPDEIFVSQVKITAKEEIKNGVVQIIKFNGKPNSVGEAENSFAYLKIDPINFENDDIEKVEIDFLVDKKWAEENGLDLSKGILYRDSGSGWDENTGEQKNSLSGFLVFRTELPGFSYFAISASELTENTNGTDVSKEMQVQEVQVKQEVETEPETVQKAPTMLLVLNKLKNPPAVLMLSAFIFAGLFAYGLHTKKVEIPKVSLPKIKLKKPDLARLKSKISLIELPKRKKNLSEKMPVWSSSKPPVNIEVTPTMRAVLDALHYREQEIMETLILLGGDSTQAKIYHKTRMPTTTLSRWVDSLEKRGLVETKKHGKLRRVWLTEKFLK